MTKTNAQARTASKTAKAAKPDVNKDAIVQSSGSKTGEDHFVKSFGGETLSFPTAQWTGEIRKLSAIGASFNALKAAVEAMPATKPAAQLARGVTAKDAVHSAKAVSDAAAKGKAKASNKADAATQKAPKAKSADAKTAKLEAADARKIVAVVANPKREGTASFLRFAKYKVGQTVAQALAAGVTRGDIDWDSKRGFIKFG